MLTVHHMGISQSERIVWLCEELDLEYKLVLHKRAPLVSPDSLKSIPGNETGKAPFVEDSETGKKLSESAAICEYIIFKYGDGKLAAKPSDGNYWEYLYWFHYSNGTFQPAKVDLQFLEVAGVPADNMIRKLAVQRLEAAHQHLDQRLATSKYLAGDELTAADVMTLYSVTTQRYWGNTDLGPYKHLLRWIKECSERPAYQEAMKKCEPEMELLLGAEAPKIGMIAAGGVNSEHWKKK